MEFGPWFDDNWRSVRWVVLIRPIFHRAVVERSTPGPIDRSSFLSFRSSSLTRQRHRSPGWAAPDLGGQVLTKNLLPWRLHCAEWSCVVLSDSPHRHNGSGRDWPYKSATRTKLGCRSSGGSSKELWKEECAIIMHSHGSTVPDHPRSNSTQDTPKL